MRSPIIPAEVRLKAIVLDLDGPILDGKLRHYSCYRDILIEHGFQPIEIEEYWRLKRERVNRQELLNLSGAGAIYDGFLAAWLERIERADYLECDRLQPEVLAILRAWRAEGLRLYLVTLRNNPENLMRQLERLRLRELFDEVFVIGNDNGSASALGQSKAARVRHLADEVPAAMLWIGDTEVDIQAARELGIFSCAVENGLRTRDFLAGLHPDVLTRDLASFSRTPHCFRIATLEE